MNQEKQYKDITVDMGNGITINKSAESQRSNDDLKQIRLDIKEAKANKDLDAELAKLKEFQQFHIDIGFTHGTGEKDRYIKRLKKLGMDDEAEKQQKIVDDAVTKMRDAHKR